MASAGCLFRHRGHFEIINYEKSGKFIKIKWKLCIEKIYRWSFFGEKIINIIEIRFISNYNFNWFEVIQKDLFIATHFWVLPRRWCSGRGARWWCHIYLKVLLADEWQWVGKCVASFHNGPTPSDIYISCSNSIYDHCICGRGTGKLFQIAHEWEDMAI